MALAPPRRSELLAWASRAGALVIEDDYDAEYRYDRPPLAAMQGLAPERVAYIGTVSKTLAPALRIGWMVLPARLMGPVLEQRALIDHGNPVLDQIALARMFESGDYDRHLRQARRRYRARRDALADAVAEHLPGAGLQGLAAGLHAVLRLGRAVDGESLVRSARERSVGVYPLGYSYHRPRRVHDGLVLGYANLAEPAIEEGVRRLSRALAAIRASARGDEGRRCYRQVVAERPRGDRAIFDPHRERGDGAARHHASHGALDAEQPAVFALVGIREGAVGRQGLLPGS